MKSFFKLRSWDILLLTFLVLCIISAILAEDKELAIMGTGYRCEGITMYFVYASLYICGRLITDQKQQRILLISYGIAIATLSIMTLLQCNPEFLSSLGMIGHNLTATELNFSKFAAIYSNTNHYAYVLNMAIVGLAGLSYFAKGWKKYLLVGLFGFNLWALIVLLIYCLQKLPKLSNELIVVGSIIFAYCVSAFFGNTMYNTTIYYYIFLGILSTCHKKGTA